MCALVRMYTNTGAAEGGLSLGFNLVFPPIIQQPKMIYVSHATYIHRYRNNRSG